MKINVLSLIVTLLLAANFCHGQDAKETAAKPENQNKPKIEKKVGNKPQPPQPFRPSEEVSADAVISFPTDI
jgi:hypothetical protein